MNDLTNDLTELAIILDRSGSMSSIKEDMEGGLWTTITEQNGLPGRCRVSLYQFDTQWETVFEGKPAGEIKKEDCLLVPRGSTALHDAVVKSLSSLEARILKEPETDRPGSVVVVMITDGQENASSENNLEQAREIIDRVTNKYGWEFLFLAADKDGFADGAAMMQGTKGRNLMYNTSDVRGASARVSQAVSSYRMSGNMDIDASDLSDSDDTSNNA